MLSAGLGLGLGPSGALWTPRALPGIVAWWSSDSGITTVSGAVSHWLDKVGGQDLAQATAGNRPTYNATDADFKGRPSIQFAATSGCQLACSTITVAQPDTIGCIVKCTSTTSQTWIDSPGTRQAIGSDGAGHAFAYAGGLQTTTVDASIGVHLFMVVFNGASGVVYGDSASANVNVGANSLVQMLVGGNAVSGIFGGKVVDVFVCSGALTAAHAALYRNYSKGIYGFA